MLWPMLPVARPDGDILGVVLLRCLGSSANSASPEDSVGELTGGYHPHAAHTSSEELQWIEKLTTQDHQSELYTA